MDDEPHVRQTLRIALETAGYEVADCANGKEAIENLQRRPFSLVISDLNMPEEDGVGVSVYLLRHQSRVKLIAITGDPTPVVSESALKLGAVRVFTKPLALAEVVKEVETLLGGATP